MRSASLMLLTLLLAGCAARRSAAPPAAGTAATMPITARIDSAVARGVAFLRQSQQAEGFWGTGCVTRGFEVLSQVPGSHDAFRTATTALCVMALAEAGEREAHARGLEWLMQQGDARRDNSYLLYNIWAHLYALQALSAEARRSPADAAPLVRAAQRHIDRLNRYQTYVGGWNYYDFVAGTQQPSMEPTSFGTAAALVALHEAHAAGIELPRPMVERALRRLLEQRLPNGSYIYSGNLKYFPRMPANMPRGSIGRNQACNLALWLWGFGGIGRQQAIDGLEEFAREHHFIEIGRKRQYPHEAWYQTAPYYYYFGHYYAARLIEMIGGPEARRYAQLLAEWILAAQDPDGSWWDFAMWDYHQPYGTAFAIMTLLRCREYCADTGP